MPSFGASKSYDCRSSSRLFDPRIRIVRKAAYDRVFR